MTPEFSINAAAQQCIDEHLDAIDDALRQTGMSRSERQSVLDDVQTQILEMLAARCEGTPTEQDVVAVLAELDPPESFLDIGEFSLTPNVPKSNNSDTARVLSRTKPPRFTAEKLALAVALGGILIPAFMAWVSTLYGRVFMNQAFAMALYSQGLALFLYLTIPPSPRDRGDLSFVFLNSPSDALDKVALMLALFAGTVPVASWNLGVHANEYSLVVAPTMMAAALVLGIVTITKPCGKAAIAASIVSAIIFFAQQ
jgi:hypothetical protein